MNSVKKNKNSGELHLHFGCKQYFIGLAVCLESLICADAYALGGATGTSIPLNNFTVNAGTINAPCTAGAATATCRDLVVDDGFLLREVTLSGVGAESGSYMQYILTNPGATGNPAAAPFSGSYGNVNFTNVDVVAMYNRSGGIASRMTLADSNPRLHRDDLACR